MLKYNYGRRMQTTNLRRVEGSAMPAVPPAPLEILGLRPVKRGRLVIKPEKRPRYTLDDLLAGTSAGSSRRKRDRQWVAGKPAGRELI